MNMRCKQAENKKRTKPYLIFFIIYTATIFISELFYRKPLFNLSINLASQLNETETNFKNFIILAEKFSNFFSTYKFYALVILFLYNSANIFKTFVFIITLLISFLIGSYLKIIYHNPLMYYDIDGF